MSKINCHSLEKTCGRLENPRNGFVIQGQTNADEYGRQVTYFCNTEFKIKGSEVRKCGASGQWDGEEPICQREYKSFC